MNQIISDLFDKDLAAAVAVPKIKQNLKNKVGKTMETVYVKKSHKGLWIALIVLCAVAVGVYFLIRYLHKDDEFEDDLDDDDLDFLDDDDDEKKEEPEEEAKPASYAEAPVESAADKTEEKAEETAEETAKAAAETAAEE